MLAAKTGAWKCQISGPPPILSLYRVAHFLLAAEIFPQFISATWGFNGAFRPKVCLLCFGGIYVKCGCEGKGRGGWLGPSVPRRRRLSWGTRTHLALMLLGCPAVRVRGTTRPHPFKASPGKRPCWKPRLSMREEPHFFIFFPLCTPADKSVVNLCRGRSADTTLSLRVVDMETEAQWLGAKTQLWETRGKKIVINKEKIIWKPFLFLF